MAGQPPSCCRPAAESARSRLRQRLAAYEQLDPRIQEPQTLRELLVDVHARQRAEGQTR